MFFIVYFASDYTLKHSKYDIFKLFFERTMFFVVYFASDYTLKNKLDVCFIVIKNIRNICGILTSQIADILLDIQ